MRNPPRIPNDSSQVAGIFNGDANLQQHHPFPREETFVKQPYQDGERQIFRPIFKKIKEIVVSNPSVINNLTPNSQEVQEINRLAVKILSDEGKEKLTQFIAKEIFAESKRVEKLKRGEGMNFLLNAQSIAEKTIFGQVFKNKIAEVKNQNSSNLKATERRKDVHFGEEIVAYSSILELNKVLSFSNKNNIPLDRSLLKELTSFYVSAIDHKLTERGFEANYVFSAGYNIKNPESSIMLQTMRQSSHTSSLNALRFSRSFSAFSRDDSKEILSQTREVENSADIRVYNALIDGLKKISNQQGFDEVFKEIKSEKRGCEINQGVVNDLIGGVFEHKVESHRVGSFLQSNLLSSNVGGLSPVSSLRMSSSSLDSPYSPYSPDSQSSQDFPPSFLGQSPVQSPGDISKISRVSWSASPYSPNDQEEFPRSGPPRQMPNPAVRNPSALSSSSIANKTHKGR